VTVGAEKGKAGSARRSPGLVPKDPGSIPGTSTNENAQSFSTMKSQPTNGLLCVGAQYRRPSPVGITAVT
jgi:hypothetical protein